MLRIATTGLRVPAVAITVLVMAAGALRARALPQGGGVYLTSITLSPTSVTGGSSSTGTATLSGAAPTGGAAVTLSSNNTAATVPASVTVPAGSTTVYFTLGTNAVTTLQIAIITGTYNGLQTAQLAVTPVGYTVSLVSITAVPPSATGGNTATGQVSLSNGAAGNTIVSLSSSNGAVSMPATVTVLSGQTTAQFTISTTPVSTQTSATLTATLASISVTCAFTVYPPQLDVMNGFVITPNTITGGLTANGVVRLTGAAPSGGAVIAFTTTNAAAVAVPATVTIPAGQTSLNVPIPTSTVNYSLTLTVTATYSGSFCQAPLTLNPANLRVTQIIPRNTLVLTWDSTSNNGFILQRDGTTVATLPSSASSYNDVMAAGFVSGHAYQYLLRDSVTNAQLSTCEFEPILAGASDNQAVDSRIDPRYSTNVFQDFAFGSTTYRGGLFAGYASDPSRIGRSFVLWPSPGAAPTGGTFRLGSVNAWSTGAYTTHSTAVSVPVACQSIPNTSWTGSSMVWSTQPVGTGFNPAAGSTTTVAYTPANGAPGWQKWQMNDAIKAAMVGGLPFSAALTAPNETSYGWAYFAKSQYGAATAPCLAVGWDFPVPLAMTLNPTSAYSGQSVTATVTMNGLGPGDTAQVTIRYDGTGFGGSLTGLPVTIAAGGFAGTRTVTFQVSANGLVGTWYVPIIATCNGMSAQAILTIHGM